MRTLHATGPACNDEPAMELRERRRHVMNNQSRDLTVSRDSFQTQRAGQSTSHTSQGVLGEELYSWETSEPSRTSFPEASVSAPW